MLGQCGNRLCPRNAKRSAALETIVRPVRREANSRTVEVDELLEDLGSEGPLEGLGAVLKKRAFWSGGSHGTQTDRTGYPYEIFIPPFISSSEVVLPSDVTAKCEAAAIAVVKLNQEEGTKNLEAVAASMLRSESVASSRIEGLRVSHRRVAEAMIVANPRYGQQVAIEVAKNVSAMTTALETGNSTSEMTVGMICSVHEALLADTSDDEIAGQLRTKQNWIGGPSRYGPRGALYVPPPPTLVPELLQDLVRFMSRDDLSPIAQAAIVHSQFEAIHPFDDGNGRTGRCLIHIVLRRRGLAPSVTPPISAALMINRYEYFARLADYQQRGDAAVWVREFAIATAEAVEGARGLAKELLETSERWRTAVGNPRRDSIADRLLQSLPATPLVSAESVAELFGVDQNVARRGLNHLQEVGILRPVRNQRRYRVWAADDIFDLLDEFEHRLTNGKGPTRYLRGR